MSSIYKIHFILVIRNIILEIALSLCCLLCSLINTNFANLSFTADLPVCVFSIITNLIHSVRTQQDMCYVFLFNNTYVRFSGLEYFLFIFLAVSLLIFVC
jgi:hypothetical protein